MAAKFDLTQEQGVQTYLETRHGQSPVSVKLLTGGTANYVYRITWQDGATHVLKHAAPYLHSDKNFAFDQARMDFEAYILGQAPSFQEASITNRIHAVQLLDYDATEKALTIEDGGELNLKDSYSQPWLDISEVAKYLAKWLTDLHTRSLGLKLSPAGHTSGNNHIGVKIYRHSYINIHSALLKFGYHPSIAKSINDEIGSLLETDDECVCHGDFWPGNVLVRKSPETRTIVDSGTSAPVTLTICDWEMVRRGTSATDVGQFAAEAFLLDRFRGARGLRKSFLSAYIKNRHDAALVGKGWICRMAVHWGVHVAFWPTRVEWTDEEGTKELVDIGVEVVKHAMNDRWEQLRSSPLFEGLGHEWDETFSKA